MALSLDSIHQPLNDFFLNKFTVGTGSPILFRFDKFGSVISEKDYFIDPNHPELGYSTNVATEQFSELVNHVPIEDADGLNIFLSQSKVDDAYSVLLTSSTPFVPSGTDAQTTEDIISSFGAIKNDALKAWQNVKLESMTGLFEFKPSLATPKDWYNRSNQDNWTHQKFEITQPATPSPVDNTTRLWKLKPDDATMQAILTEPQVHAVHPQLSVIAANLNLIMTPSVAQPAPAPFVARPVIMMQRGNFAAPIRANTVEPIKANVVAPRPNFVEASSAPTKYLLFDAFKGQARALPFAERIAVKQTVDSNSPTQPATTDNISISFDYCLVNINRPWYRDVFITNSSWCIPGTAKGAVTTHNPSATNLTLIPVGIIVIKNLNIQANWSASDISNSQNATEFGPFKVGTGIVNGSLSHEGIQVIGWLLQRMPGLPPNDPPA